MRYKKIVLGTDGSGMAALAQRVAISMAKTFTARLIVVQAHESRAPGARVLERAAEAGRHAGLGSRISTESVKGSAADALVEVAEREDADLIVVGSRGLSRAQRVLLGSVSTRVAHHAPCDVLVVRGRAGGESPRIPYQRFLVATDGSPTADRACRKAYDIAAKMSGRITLVFVGHPKTGEIVTRDTHAMLEEKVDATFRILDGDPADRICATAEADELDLIVVGNKGMTGASRFLLGSVPEKVLQHAPCDVLVARTATQVLTDLKKGEGAVVAHDGRKLAVSLDDDGTLVALNAKCTHLGCTVAWNAAERSWDCPCHGSRFAPTGEVISGPAAKPLPRTDL